MIGDYCGGDTRMDRKLNFFDVVNSMRNRVPVTIRVGQSHVRPVTGIVNAIEAEDGSGQSWILTFDENSNTDGAAVRKRIFWNESTGRAVVLVSQ
jgi:hypothetical protein